MLSKTIHKTPIKARYCYSLGNVDRTVEFCWFDCLILEETERSMKIEIIKWSFQHFAGSNIKWVRKSNVFKSVEVTNAKIS